MFSRLVIWTLVFQFSFPSWAAPAPTASNSAQTLISQIESLTFTEHLQIPEGDPILDRDPFFLRAQHWLNPSSTSCPSDNCISMPGGNSAWAIDPAFHMILDTDRRLYFRYSGDSEHRAEADSGIFFLERHDLLLAAQESLPVPIYFFPLPGQGWNSEQPAYESPQNGAVVFTNRDGFSLPVLIEDIDLVHEAERDNLVYAFHQKTLALTGKLGEKSKPAKIALDPGATAGFGTLFSGRLENGRSFFQAQTRFDRFRAWASNLLGGIVPEARADWGSIHHVLSTPEAQAILEKLSRVGTVIKWSAIAGVALKYTLLKQKIEARRANRGEPKPKDILSLLKREALESGDVFAELMKTVYQFPGVTLGNATEYLLDRFIPSLASADNTVIRKFFKLGIDFVRNTFKHVVVDLRTWLLAAAFLGGWDSINYTIQFCLVTPALLEILAGYFPWLQSRVHDAMTTSLSNTIHLQAKAIAQNVAGWLAGGPPFLIVEKRAELLGQVTAEEDVKFRKQGRHPDQTNDPKIRHERQRVLTATIEAGLQAALKADHYATSDQFLFDANSVFFGTLALLGYQIPAKAAQEGFKPEEFAAVERPGLVLSSLRRAHTSMSYANRSASTRTATTTEAERLLAETLNDSSILKSAITGPFRAAFGNNQKPDSSAWRRLADETLRFKRAREAMVALTYEGDGPLPEALIPESWKGANPEAIALASEAFRREFLRLQDGEASQTPADDPSLLPKSLKRKPGWLARRQEEYAFRLADEAYFKEVGDVYQIETATAAQTTRWKTLYSEALAHSIGLYPDFSDKPELEAEFRENVAILAEAELSNPAIQRHLSSLTVFERQRAEARLYAECFTETYVNFTVRLGKLGALSSGQPGRFQKVRRLAWVKKRNWATRIVRAAEASFPETEYRTGVRARIDRSIPAWFDLYTANLREYRRTLAFLSVGYAFDYFFWGLNWTPAEYLLWMSTRFLYTAPAQTANRAFVMQGWQPLKNWKMMFLYGTVYSWLSFGAQFFQIPFAKDMKNAVQPAEDALHSVLSSCKELLGRVVSRAHGPSSNAQPLEDQ